ncbi:MAG: S8 family serine peptidase [Planctomycetia bacterium]
MDTRDVDTRFFGRSTVRTKARDARRARPLAEERLEPRMLMAVDTTSSFAVNRIVWNGDVVNARADAWIVRSEAQPAAIGVRSGWQTASLGDGFLSLVAPGASANDVLGWARSTAGVRSVEPDRVVTASATLPNDPSFNRLWGLQNAGQTGGLADADIDAPEAWDVTTGSRSVVVAVVDTGVDYNHSDLAANMWRNPGETAGDGIDNDGNGFVDDVFGWNFVTNTANVFDDNSHGTHVAGTIGAVGSNGAGVVGVNWQVSIMALKFLDASGSGTTSAAIAALNYATMMRRTYGVNIVATNNSWGGGGASTALRDAITAGGNAGILCIAAAGNDSTNNDSVGHYPSNSVGTWGISVAATDSSNRLASFSNYGATTVHVAAPGVGIYSTTPNNTYASYSGTSMATPHVTGLVALMAAANPQATAAQIRSTILSTVTAVSGLAGTCSSGGIINAAAAVQAMRGTTPTEPSPVADIIDVTPDPRTTSVGAVLVRFDRAVTGVDVSDLTLSRNGISVPLSDATITTTDNLTWTLAGLDPLTVTAGSYSLTLNAAGSGIVSINGGTPLAVSASDAWTVQAASLVDAGDTIATAAPVGITTGDLRLSGRIGDGSFGARDVDLYRVTLAAGQSLVIDIDAQSLAGSSTLDSYVRIFNAAGRQVAANDDASGSLDSYLAVRAMTGGTFFVGISGYGNASYSPTRGGSGRRGSTGDYQVRFAFSSLAATAGVARVAGFRDARGAASSPAGLASAFAMYGANWNAALPSAPSGQRPFRRASC